MLDGGLREIRGRATAHLASDASDHQFFAAGDRRWEEIPGGIKWIPLPPCLRSTASAGSGLSFLSLLMGSKSATIQAGVHRAEVTLTLR